MNPTATTQAHAEAESLWHFNFSDRPTEEFAGLRDVCERESRRERFRAMLPEAQSFLHYHLAALSDDWLPLSALYGHKNIGARHAEYETLVWLGIADRRTETLYAPGGRVCGSRALFRLSGAV